MLARAAQPHGSRGGEASAVRRALALTLPVAALSARPLLAVGGRRARSGLAARARVRCCAPRQLGPCGGSLPLACGRRARAARSSVASHVTMYLGSSAASLGGGDSATDAQHRHPGLQRSGAPARDRRRTRRGCRAEHFHGGRRSGRRRVDGRKCRCGRGGACPPAAAPDRQAAECRPLAARRAGVDEAVGEYVLLLDGRVRIRPGALSYVESRIAQGRRIWTAHVHVEAKRNPYGAVLVAARGARVARLLRRPARHELRHRRVRSVSEGHALFPRAEDAARGCNRARSEPLHRPAARERRHAPDTFARGTGAHQRFARLRLRLPAEDDVHRFSRPLLPSRHRLRRRPRARRVAILSGRRGLLSDQRARSRLAVRRPRTAVWAAVSRRRGRRGRVRASTPPERGGDACACVLAPVYAAAHGAGMWRGLGLSARRLREDAPRPPQPPQARAPSRPLAEEGREPEKKRVSPAASASGVGSTVAPPEARTESIRPGTA